MATDLPKFIAGNGTFLIQDPLGLRTCILPVVAIGQKKDEIIGLGTCFQISPWRWLTAHHVVQYNDMLAFPPDTVAAIGFSFGYIYGKHHFLTTDHFAEISELKRFQAIDTAEVVLPFQAAPPPIVIDIAAIHANPAKVKEPRLDNPLPISRTSPSIGEEVLAIGFPILGSKHDVAHDGIAFEERMYGAPGKIVELLPDGQSTSKPWPSFRIEGNWKSGMSGGPVINASGEVVGVVSSSFEPTTDYPGIGYAVDITRIAMHALLPDMDLNHPGFAFAYGVIVENNLVRFAPDEATAHEVAKTVEGAHVRYISVNPRTEEWVTV